MWKVGLGSPEQKIDEEMGWHNRNISVQVHGVTRIKKKGNAIASTMKWYGGINSQKAHCHRKWKHGLSRKMKLLLKQCPIQKRIKGWEYEPKSSHILHATKDKHQLAHIAESNKHGSSTNGVKARKKQSSDEVEHSQRARAPPTCTQPIHGRWAMGQNF